MISVLQHLARGRTDAHVDRDRFLITELAMKAIVIIGIVLAIAITFGAVWQELDPLYPILLAVFPQFVLKSTYLFYFLRICIFASVICESYPVLTIFYLSLLIYMISLKEITCKVIKLLKSSDSHWNTLKLRSRILLGSISMFRQCQIYMILNRQAYFWNNPVLICSGSTLMVVSNYITIKLYRTLGMPLYLAAPFLSAAVFVFTVVVLPAATSIFDESEELLFHLKASTRTRHHKKIVRSLKPFGMRTVFFMMKNMNRRKIIEAQVYYTITLLLSC
jgi:hypothetical protein